MPAAPVSTTPNPVVPKKSKAVLWWSLAAVVVVAIGGLTWAKVRRNPNGEPVTTEKAQVRTITQLVTATGKIQPEIEVKITSEEYGEITALPFREGAAVKKGDLIVQIKPDLYQAMVDQASAAVNAAKSAALVGGANLVKAESDYRRYKDLYDVKLASDADYASYTAAYDVAKANVLAEHAAVQEAEGSLHQARDALSKTTIFAPMDGTVSSLSCEVGERVQGATSFAGTEIMRVADLGNMEDRVLVNENDIPNVKIGNHVLISIDAYPDRKFNGFVREIGSSAASAGATGSGAAAQSTASTGDEVTNFLVKITVTDRDVQLRPGMSATADIETQTVRNAVVVPIQSVTVRSAGGLSSDEFQKQQAKAAQDKTGNVATAASDKDQARRTQELLQRVVFVREGNKVKLRRVETGIADDTWIEVKRGVQPGEQVVSGSYAAISRRLKDGAVVRTDRPKKDDSQN